MRSVNKIIILILFFFTKKKTYIIQVARNRYLEYYGKNWIFIDEENFIKYETKEAIYFFNNKDLSYDINLIKHLQYERKEIWPVKYREKYVKART